MRNHRSLFILALLPVLMTGCSRQILTPPTRVVEFETPKTLEKGRTSLEAAGGFEGTFFNGQSMVGGATARRGFGQGLEGSLGLTAYRFLEAGKITADVNPWVVSAHAGGKYNPAGYERYLAILAGAGAGTSNAGQFVSGDLGFTGGLENRYLVPYLGARGMVNVPFATRPLDLSDPGSTPGTSMDEAETTFGVKGFVGLKLLPFYASGSRLAPSLILELNAAHLMDDDHEHGYAGAFLGAQFPLGG